MSGRQSHIKQAWKVSTAMGKDTYIHGIGSAEQERLTLLNRLTNQSFIDFLALADTRSILDIGSGLGTLTEQVAGGLLIATTPASSFTGIARQD